MYEKILLTKTLQKYHDTFQKNLIIDNLFCLIHFLHTIFLRKNKRYVSKNSEHLHKKNT